MFERVMKNEHVRIGHTATGDHKNSKWRVITSLSIYDAVGLGRERLIGMTARGPDGTSVLYLSDSGALEVVKGFLTGLLSRPISMAAKDEFRDILARCQKAIELQDKDAEQIVRCLKENPGTRAGA